MGLNNSFKPVFCALLLLGMTIPACLSGFLPSAEAKSASSENFLMFNLSEDAPSSKIKVLNARIVIDAPPVMVWQTLTNYNKHKEFIPGYKKTDLVSCDGNAKVLDVIMNVGQFLPNYHYKVRVLENKQSYELKMNRISGDFQHLSANYQLYPKSNGNQTILSYSIKLDPGLTLPGVNVSTLMKSNAEKTLKAIESRSEQEHKKSLIGQR